MKQAILIIFVLFLVVGTGTSIYLLNSTHNDTRNILEDNSPNNNTEEKPNHNNNLEEEKFPSSTSEAGFIVNNFSLQQEFNLTIDKSAENSSLGIIITFINVTGDSRCPTDLLCFWEGTVSLVVGIKYLQQDLGNYNLNLSNLHKVSFANYYVKLVTLYPYPETTDSIPLSSYIATFVVNEYGPD